MQKFIKIIKKVLELAFVVILVVILDYLWTTDTDWGGTRSLDFKEELFLLLMFFPIILNEINEYLNKNSEKKTKMPYHLIFTFLIFIVGLYLL